MTGPAREASGAITGFPLTPAPPLVHTPGNRSLVPQGQAAAGAATTSGAAANATAQPKATIPRFTATGNSKRFVRLDHSLAPPVAGLACDRDDVMTVDLSTAWKLVAAAHAEAARRSVAVSAAVVDGGGHLVAFGRMDGAEIAGPVLAVDKAYTAVANRIATAELAVLAAPGGELFGIQANGGGRFVIFAGGVPIVADGNVIGGIGVSGASTADDDACARAGLAAWGSRHASPPDQSGTAKTR